MNRKIEIRLLSKSFTYRKEAIQVLKEISFDVIENEFLVILGPGGCGKTTLLKIIVGELDFDKGEVNISGGKSIGFVFQSFSIFPWMTVQQNIEFGLKMRNVPDREKRETASKYIDLVGLKGFEAYYPKQISGGMKQRVGIARMLAISPQVMLMDNPFGHLDAQTKYHLEEELLRIWDQERKTVIFVTNDIEEAIFLADRIILLSKLPAEIKEQFEVHFQRRETGGKLLQRGRTSGEFLSLRKTLTEAF
jgi:NitT/TauT family transport system ATP-binding protein